MSRFLRRYRRSLAFVLAFVGVTIALASLRERPHTWTATVIAADLPAGHVVRAADLRTAAVDVGLQPSNAITNGQAAVGRVLAGPVAAGELLVEHRLVGPSLLDGSPPGHVAVPINLDDPDDATFIRRGDIVDVMAARRSVNFGEDAGASATIVASSVRVLALPGTNAGGVDGLLGGSPSTGASQGVVVVAGMSPTAAAAVAGAATSSRLSLLVQGSTATPDPTVAQSPPPDVP